MRAIQIHQEMQGGRELAPLPYAHTFGQLEVGQ